MPIDRELLWRGPPPREPVRADLPFKAILMDPPWPERGGGKIKRGADRHYDLIKKKEEILRVVLQSGVWRPCPAGSHLWMWTTNNYLPWALWLIEAMGYSYKTNFPWVKPGRMGVGQYGRGCHELLLFSVRGSGYDARQYDPETSKYTWARTDALVGVERVKDPDTGKIIHSAKPPESYDLVEHISRGPYLEMFARNARRDWVVWGNEIEGKSREV
jgi:N6-adenosine-specific RNA methylase IME4